MLACSAYAEREDETARDRHAGRGGDTARDRRQARDLDRYAADLQQRRTQLLEKIEAKCFKEALAGKPVPMPLALKCQRGWIEAQSDVVPPVDPNARWPGLQRGGPWLMELSPGS
jgi:hypothetical protein